MHIGGVVKNSFVDYPGKIACTIFTIGCNYNCWYCHNSHLLSSKDKIDENKVLEFLRERKNWLDGVVVSGGEPTLQPDLEEFIKKIKDMDYPVKLDTNGSNFDVLKRLVDNKLVDYVAMDIKAPFDKYKNITQTDVNIENVKKSIEFLKSGQVDYEFRTTFSPDLTVDDIESICKEIKGAKNYSIQKYRVVEYNKINMKPKNHEEHMRARDVAKKYVQNVLVKGD